MSGKWNWVGEPIANFDATLEVSFALSRATGEYRRAIAAAEEAEIRRLLEHWVSGLTPAVARTSGGGIIGLCDADAPLDSEPFIFYRRR